MPSASSNYESGNVTEYLASGTITANGFVKYGTVDSTTGNPTVVECSAITDVAIGVSLNTVASGAMCQVQTAGVAKVRATAAAITALDQVMCGASGRCVTAAGATAVSQGIAETGAAGTVDEVIPVRLAVPNLKGPANS